MPVLIAVSFETDFPTILDASNVATTETAVLKIAYISPNERKIKFEIIPINTAGIQTRLVSLVTFFIKSVLLKVPLGRFVMGVVLMD